MEIKEKYLDYLDRLRESGIPNMFGAPPYLRQKYPELSDSESRTVFAHWMQTFADRHEEKKEETTVEPRRVIVRKRKVSV